MKKKTTRIRARRRSSSLSVLKSHKSFLDSKNGFEDCVKFISSDDGDDGDDHYGRPEGLAELGAIDRASNPVIYASRLLR